MDDPLALSDHASRLHVEACVIGRAGDVGPTNSLCPECRLELPAGRVAATRTNSRHHVALGVGRVVLRGQRNVGCLTNLQVDGRARIGFNEGSRSCVGRRRRRPAALRRERRDGSGRTCRSGSDTRRRGNRPSGIGRSAAAAKKEQGSENHASHISETAPRRSWFLRSWCSNRVLFRFS